MSQLGFSSEGIQSESFRRITVGGSPEYAQSVICRFIRNQNDEAKVPVIVSIERDAFVIYGYDWTEVLYRIWKELRGDVSDRQLRDMILEASLTTNVTNRISAGWRD